MDAKSDVGVLLDDDDQRSAEDLRVAVETASDAPLVPSDASKPTPYEVRLREGVSWLALWASFVAFVAVVALPLAGATWLFLCVQYFMSLSEIAEDTGALHPSLFTSAWTWALVVTSGLVMTEWFIRFRYSDHGTWIRRGFWLFYGVLALMAWGEIDDCLAVLRERSFALEVSQFAFLMGVFALWSIYLGPRIILAWGVGWWRFTVAQQRSNYRRGLWTGIAFALSAAGLWIWFGNHELGVKKPYWPGTPLASAQLAQADSSGLARSTRLGQAGFVVQHVGTSRPVGAKESVRNAMTSVAAGIIYGAEPDGTRAGHTYSEAVYGRNEPIVECVRILRDTPIDGTHGPTYFSRAALRMKRAGVPHDRNLSDALDVLTAVCIRYEGLIEPSKVAHYYNRAISNSIISYRRRLQRHAAVGLVSVGDVTEGELGYIAHEEYHAREMLACLTEFFSRDEREALTLVVLGHTASEVAASLGISISAAEKRVQRAKKKAQERVVECGVEYLN